MTFREAESYARRVWALFGESQDMLGSFPRDLASLVSWVIPICVFTVPDLDTQRVRIWLQRHEIGIPLPCADRRLRGVFIAGRGSGAVLLDASDTINERRFTFAHECAHFLLEYHWPREEALRIMGDGICPVLDGERPPTREERVSAILKGTSLGVMTHLMDRGPDLRIRSDRVLKAEDAADALAIELLAPRQCVAKEVLNQIRSWRQSRAETTTASIAEQRFGLPSDVAVRFAERLVGMQRAGTSFREWLGHDTHDG